MTLRLVRIFLLAAGLVAAAKAQFQLFLVSGTEKPVAAVYDFGTVSTGDTVPAQFRIRNTSNASATLTLLKVLGSGFSIASGPQVPTTLNPQASVDFTIRFSTGEAGGYSASLLADGISTLLTITVVPGLSYSVEASSGKQALGIAAVNFGSVQTGQTIAIRFDIDNSTDVTLTIPPIALLGGPDFTLGNSPSGMILAPGQGSNFDVQFQPSSAGARSGTLTIGLRTYTLAGTGVAPLPPKPLLTISLANPQSSQQGSVAIGFDAPAPASGSGSLTLSFQPTAAGAADPTIAFASGGQVAGFTWVSGDTASHFGSQTTALFQTGTTAGTLTFTAQTGGGTAQSSIVIAPAPVVIVSSRGTRPAGAIDVQLTGFDNTRTAGQTSFTFFDANGNVIGPASILADASTAFSQFFQGSDVGGSFVLHAVFPVTGDPSRIASFQAVIRNSAGTATVSRTTF